MKVACLGAGYFSQFHIAAWRRIAGVALVGVCDNDHERASATGLPAFSDLDALLDKACPDILDIILPPAAHAAAIDKAIAAGVKTIICQKPFCTSLAQAKAVVSRAQSAGTCVIVHENFRFQPWYRTIRDAIAEGMIGVPLQASFRFRPGDGQGPDAYLDRQPYFQQMPRFLIHETAVHWIDTFRFLFGPVQAVYADLVRLNPTIAGEDSGHVVFDHADGVRSHFDGNRLLDHAAENTRCTMGDGVFEGTKGVLTLSGDGAVNLRPFRGMKQTQLLGPDTSGTFGGDCVFHLQSHVVTALRDGTPPENTAQHYLNVMEIEEAIYRSADAGKKIIMTNSHPE